MIALMKRERRDPQVFAGNCPKCGARGRVRRTMERVRYCYCRDPKCGASWSKVPCVCKRCS